MVLTGNTSSKYVKSGRLKYSNYIFCENELTGCVLALYVEVGLAWKHSCQICINVSMCVGAGRKYSCLICRMTGVERACISLLWAF